MIFRRSRVRVGNILLMGLTVIVIYLKFRPDTGMSESLTSNGGSLREDHQELIKAIKTHLSPPGSSSVPYKLANLTEVGRPGEKFHEALLQTLSSHKIGPGFFVECGALDGKYLSETLDLEMHANWTGLLIEGSPSKVPLLKSKNRKAWIADACLTGEPHRKVEFIMKIDQSVDWKRGNGKINPVKNPEDEPVYFEGNQEYKSEGYVDCYSLHHALIHMKSQFNVMNKILATRLANVKPV